MVFGEVGEAVSVALFSQTCLSAGARSPLTTRYCASDSGANVCLFRRWTIDDCTWQIPSDFSPDFIHKFNETAAAEGRGGSQDLTLLKEAEDGLRANPNVGWNRFEPIGNVLHMLDDEN